MNDPTPGTDPGEIVKDLLACDVSQIPAVFDHLKKDGKDGSFVIFMFQPRHQWIPKDDINIQFSIEGGRIGLDWCLFGPANIRDQEKFEGFISGLGGKSQMREANQVRYLRIEDGDLPQLCQKVICDLYKNKSNSKLNMVVEGFEWPPEDFVAHETTSPTPGWIKLIYALNIVCALSILQIWFVPRPAYISKISFLAGFSIVATVGFIADILVFIMLPRQRGIAALLGIFYMFHMGLAAMAYSAWLKTH